MTDFLSPFRWTHAKHVCECADARHPHEVEILNTGNAHQKKGEPEMKKQTKNEFCAENVSACKYKNVPVRACAPPMSTRKTGRILIRKVYNDFFVRMIWIHWYGSSMDAG